MSEERTGAGPGAEGNDVVVPVAGPTEAKAAAVATAGSGIGWVVVAVVVVEKGKTILKKGYGFADVEEQRPVDPDQTLFRIGSISKALTGLPPHERPV